MFSSLMLRDLLDQQAAYPRYYGGLLDEAGDYYLNPAAHQHPHVHFNVIRPRRQTSVGGSGRQSESGSDANKFKVMLNVKHFRPDEIDVKTVDNFVVVHGQHEEHADEHGFVSREFTRRYKLPDDVEPEKVSSHLSKDGILTIEAPKKMIEPPPKNERIVPITIQQHAAVEEANRVHQQQQEQASDEK